MEVLNEEEVGLLSRLREQHYLDEATFKMCARVYAEYRAKHGCALSGEKLAIALQCALFMAEKTQVLPTVNGETVQGVCLSLGQLLKDHMLDDVMVMLRDFSKKVVVEDAQASAALQSLICQISFLITFYRKFEKVVAKLELQERPGDPAFLRMFLSFVWLLYVHAKSVVLRHSTELIENSCMLAHCLAFNLIHGWRHVQSRGFLKDDRALSDASSFKEVSLVVKEKILEEFRIKQTQTYLRISSDFENYFADLVDQGVIHVGADEPSFLSPELLAGNYRRLDSLYDKSLSIEDLDERIFSKDRTANLTPSKFTPFARQGYANKGKQQSVFGQLNEPKEVFLSHRILNYDLVEKQERQKPLQVKDIRLPKTLLQSPSLMKVPLICSTPVTVGMEMWNYVGEWAKREKDVRRSRSKPHDDLVLPLIDRVYKEAKKDCDARTREVRANLAFGIYKNVAEEFLLKSPQEGLPMLKALLTVTLEIMLFVENSPVRFEDLESFVQPSALEEWRACDFVLNLDRAMPSPLKLHLLDVEVNLISERIWRSQAVLETVSAFVREGLPNPYVERLFRRVLHQTAFQVKTLCQGLAVDDKTAEQTFDAMKVLLSEKLALLGGRHLDQFIMCTVYAVCRRKPNPLKFSEIIETYKAKNPHLEAQFVSIIHCIPRSRGDNATLIEFYNEEFLSPMRDVIMGAVAGPVSQGRATHLLQSPLREIIPTQQVDRFKSSGHPSTGQYNLLYAYNESPLIKYEPTVNLTLKTKALNFTQTEERLKYESEQTANKLSARNVPAATGEPGHAQLAGANAKSREADAEPAEFLKALPKLMAMREDENRGDCQSEHYRNAAGTRTVELSREGARYVDLTPTVRTKLSSHPQTTPFEAVAPQRRVAKLGSDVVATQSKQRHALPKKL